MLIAILEKNGDVRLFDSYDTPMMFLTSSQERRDIVGVETDVQEKKKNGRPTAGANCCFDAIGRPEMGNIEKRVKAISKLQETLLNHPRAIAYVDTSLEGVSEGEKTRVLAVPAKGS